MRILIQYPSRSRPHQFLNGLNSIYRLASDKNNISVHVVLDVDDPAFPDYADILSQTEHSVIASMGSSLSKVHAINRPLPSVPWDILITFSDDMLFSVFGWDVLVREAFEGDLDRFVHFYEKGSGDRVSVMDMVGKEYYKRDGWIYNPVYHSLFCDEEKTTIARIQGKYKFVDQVIFEHNNPAVTGSGEQDAMLKEQQHIGWTLDKDTFDRRKQANFEISNPVL